MQGKRETWRSYKNTKRSNNKGEYRWRWRNKSGGNNNKLENVAGGHNGVHNNDGVVSEKNHDGGAAAAESAGAVGGWRWEWGTGMRSRPGDQDEAEARTTWPQHNENEGNFQFANSASRMLRKGKRRSGVRGLENGGNDARNRTKCPLDVASSQVLPAERLPTQNRNVNEDSGGEGVPLPLAPLVHPITFRLTHSPTLLHRTKKC